MEGHGKKVRSHLHTLETFKASLQLALAAFALVVDASSARIICTEIRELREVIILDAGDTSTNVPSISGHISSLGVSVTDDGFLVRRYFLEMQPPYLLSPSQPPTPRALSYVDDDDDDECLENWLTDTERVFKARIKDQLVSRMTALATLNDVNLYDKQVRTLTIISMVFLPIAFVSSVFGMPLSVVSLA